MGETWGAATRAAGSLREAACSSCPSAASSSAPVAGLSLDRASGCSTRNARGSFPTLASGAGPGGARPGGAAFASRVPIPASCALIDSSSARIAATLAALALSAMVGSPAASPGPELPCPITVLRSPSLLWLPFVVSATLLASSISNAKPSPAAASPAASPAAAAAPGVSASATSAASSACTASTVAPSFAAPSDASTKPLGGGCTVRESGRADLWSTSISSSAVRPLTYRARLTYPRARLEIYSSLVIYTR
mmetsp:Transcript_49430/g.165013  ORF Transcript_49430/g.165013 Transcript_49430/m.165013 type:complete len:252 (-) Transcript_49430:2079-2834(-)